MRKYIKFLLLLLVVIILSGCTSKLDIAECNFESKQSDYNIKSKYTIYYRDNIVEKIDIDEVISSSSKDKLNGFNKSYKKQYDSNKTMYGGYTYNIKKNKNKLELSASIDYTILDMKKFVSNNPAIKKYLNRDNKLSLDGAIKMYQASGSKCSKQANKHKRQQFD